MQHFLISFLAITSAATLSSAVPILSIAPSPQSILTARPLPTRRETQLPYGKVIDRCIVSGTIALAFDDGPYIYTEHVLDLFAEADVHATFFLNGDWKGNIYDYSHVMNRTLAEGHQIGSHSWSHLNLTTVPYQTILSEMYHLEQAFSDILGFIPTYTRTPWLHVNDLVLSAMADLQYHVIGASIFTDDKTNDASDRTGRSLEMFREGLKQGGSILLAHDSQKYTAEKLVGDMIQEVKRRKLHGKRI
ncbi:putative peptidoglycan-N-acetylglucosamine deacetylase [Penicillium oxalicum]|uniref:putative peptidoglycan-N-acetylglucosamine deacetylase n=1 Tax=Penicillium oxalicum TaxID=69781 RepID=UPI0020B76445|nr:putative peptidoglycan-N-acetylglucosamine deacetylase [Penicillium oxalicum]KAI2788475.1 putative peptidoglycan-N-acetylglucosamine deacetylase [Penicillium oxalicum]